MTSLLSTVHGSIERLLLTVPFWVLRYGHQVEIKPYKRAYEALLTLLPEGAERVLVTQSETEGQAADWLDSLGLTDHSRLLVVPDDQTFTVWAQDACLVQTRDHGAPRLVTPRRFARHDDAPVLESVAERLEIEHSGSDLSFQGGNVLVGDDFWLVGEDSIRLTVHEGSAATRAEAERAFSESLDPDRTLHVVGSQRNGPGAAVLPLADDGLGVEEWREHVRTGNHAGSTQPLFDLDTFVSLAGRGADGGYRLLVGDPRMAAELTGSPLPEHAGVEAFDDVAKQLTRAGFHVIRNPLPLVYHDDRALRRRWWYFASSNNVVSEISGSTKRVWLPTYADADFPQLQLTDERNRQIWSDLGFTVEALPSFHAFARGLGAARCICKVLER